MFARRFRQTVTGSAFVRRPLARATTAATKPTFLATPLSSSQHDVIDHKVSTLVQSFHSSCAVTMPFTEFRDATKRRDRMANKVGRRWSATELRLKSYDDLHKLWYVLYKERNMLLTELQMSRRRSVKFPQPERMKKVRKSMGAIKFVLNERKNEHLKRLEKIKVLEKEAHDDEAA